MGIKILVNLCSSGKLYKCEVTISYSKCTWITKKTNWFCTCLYQIGPWYGCIHESFFRNGSWWKQRRMGTKVKQTTLLNQASKCRLVWSYKNCSRKGGYNQYQVEPRVVYREDSVILTYVNDCVIVLHKKSTITSLIESLKNEL